MANVFKDSGCDLKDIQENLKQNAEDDLAPQQQDVYINFFVPLKELFEFKQIETNIVKQKEIVDKKIKKLNNCEFIKIDFANYIKEVDLNKGIDRLKMQKQ